MVDPLGMLYSPADALGGLDMTVYNQAMYYAATFSSFAKAMMMGAHGSASMERLSESMMASIRKGQIPDAVETSNLINALVEYALSDAYSGNMRVNLEVPGGGITIESISQTNSGDVMPKVTDKVKDKTTSKVNNLSISRFNAVASGPGDLVIKRALSAAAAAALADGPVPVGDIIGGAIIVSAYTYVYWDDISQGASNAWSWIKGERGRSAKPSGSPNPNKHLREKGPNGETKPGKLWDPKMNNGKGGWRAPPTQ